MGTSYLAHLHIITASLELTFFPCFLSHFNNYLFDFVSANPHLSSRVAGNLTWVLVCCYHGLDFKVTSCSHSYSFLPYCSVMKGKMNYFVIQSDPVCDLPADV